MDSVWAPGRAGSIRAVGSPWTGSRPRAGQARAGRDGAPWTRFGPWAGRARAGQWGPRGQGPSLGQGGLRQGVVGPHGRGPGLGQGGLRQAGVGPHGQGLGSGQGGLGKGSGVPVDRVRAPGRAASVRAVAAAVAPSAGSRLGEHRAAGKRRNRSYCFRGICRPGNSVRSARLGARRLVWMRAVASTARLQSPRLSGRLFTRVCRAAGGRQP